jgi:hypothetical protein
MLEESDPCRWFWQLSTRNGSVMMLINQSPNTDRVCEHLALAQLLFRVRCVCVVMALPCRLNDGFYGTRPAVMGLQAPSRPVPAQYSRQAESVCWAGVKVEGES